MTDTDQLSEATLDDLREVAERYPQARSALLPMLHLVQSAQGRVTAEGIDACARILDLTEAEVSAVATFYTMYKRKPMGTHHVGVCTNTLCAIMGGDEIFERLCSHLDVGNDETSADGQITLEKVECNAACDFAPVMMVNWEFFDNQTPESAVDVVDRLRAGESVQASRGATITSWREAERVIGGFEDGHVDEGPAAAGASLAGLEIAHEHGWTAPPMVSTSSTSEATSSTSEATSSTSEATSSTSEATSSDGEAASSTSEAARSTSEAEADETPTEAAEEADTARAESETVAETSEADVEGGKGDEGEAP